MSRNQSSSSADAARGKRAQHAYLLDEFPSAGGVLSGDLCPDDEATSKNVQYSPRWAVYPLRSYRNPSDFALSVENGEKPVRASTPVSTQEVICLTASRIRCSTMSTSRSAALSASSGGPPSLLFQLWGLLAFTSGSIC